MVNLSLYTTTAVFLIDSDGSRLLAKYFTPPHLSSRPEQQAAANARTGAAIGSAGVGTGGVGTQLRTLKEQRAFEKGVWDKTRKSSRTSHLIREGAPF